MRFLKINDIHYNLDRLLSIKIIPINKNKDIQDIFQTYLFKLEIDGRSEIIVNKKPMRYKDAESLRNVFINYLKDDSLKVIGFRENELENETIVYAFT